MLLAFELSLVRALLTILWARVSPRVWIPGAARNLLSDICLIIFLLFLKANPMLREGEIAQQFFIQKGLGSEIHLH